MAYENSGALFTREKKTPNAPDWGGDLEINGEVLDYILRCAERGEPVKIEISGWMKSGRNNSRFISLNGKIPYAARSQNQPYGNAKPFVPGQDRQRVQNMVQQPQRNAQFGGNSQQGQRAPVHQQPQQGGMADRAQQHMTSRGPYPATGSQQHTQFRRELNDEIPFGGKPDNSPPWE